MIDDIYPNAFKEVYEILQNTDSDLVNKIPIKFMNFLQKNMNINYKTTINNNISISQQSLLSKTEDILSLIYRSYWATAEEKKEFYNMENESIKYKNISEIFTNRKKTITQDNNLVIVSKENYIQKLLKKILKMLKFK